MNRLSHITLIMILAGLTFTACAQSEPTEPIYTKVIPGQDDISTKGFRPHSLQYQKATYKMSYEMSETDQGWLVAVAFNPGPDSKPDQMWLDKASLAFRKRHLPLKDYTIDVSMKDGLFSGNLVPTQGSDYTPVVYNKLYDHDAYEPAIINYAIAGLPLAPGYTASIPVFDLNNGSQMFWSNIKVQGEEIVTIDDIEFDCWKVNSDGIRNKTLWISKRDLIAVKMVTKGNAGSWKLVPSSLKFFK